MLVHCEYPRASPQFFSPQLWRNGTNGLRCSHQPLGKDQPVFSFWKPQSFGSQEPANKGGEHCYMLETVETERVVPTGNGSQIIRSWGKRAGSYLEEPAPKPVSFSKWPGMPPPLGRAFFCTRLICFNRAIARNSDCSKCILASWFSFLNRFSFYKYQKLSLWQPLQITFTQTSKVLFLVS